MPEPTTITCINGRFAVAHRAAVPVTDRGFRFGDGLFETMRLEGGVPYQWERHMARMASGLEAIGLTPPEVDWQAMVQKTIRKNAARDGYIRITISRGSGSRGYLPYPPGMPASFVIEYVATLREPQAAYRLWLSRWAKIPPQCLPAGHKLAQGMNSILAIREATDQGCDEALQLTTDGMVSEAGGGNLFWVKNGTLYTPSLDTACLNGTTRDALLRLSHLPVRTVNAGLDTLKEAEAIAITSVRVGLHPVSEMQPMGWHYETKHPEMEKLRQRFAEDRIRYRAENAANWVG